MSSINKALGQGAWLMIQSTLWFSLMNVFAKLVNHLPTMEVVFFRCFVSFMFCVVSLNHLKVSWHGSNNRLLLARGVSGTIALYLYFLTLHKMPLGTAVTIQYMSPIFTVIIAMIVLKERIHAWQWLFFVISFAGVILIKGFDSRIEFKYLVAGIVSSIFSAIAYTLIRTLKETEHPTVVVLHFMLIGAITGFVFMLFDFEMPHGWEWLYLFLIGASTQMGQIKMTRALQISFVGEVAILNYLGVLYAIALGYLIFNETYGLAAVLGIVLVIAGVVCNIFYRK